MCPPRWESAAAAHKADSISISVFTELPGKPPVTIGDGRVGDRQAMRH
jgi:hypothetical protein